jgi:hypothetical protein
MYQDVYNINLNSGTELIIPETSDKYVRFLVSSGLPGSGGSISFTIEYDVTLYTIHAATETVTVDNPYDTGSDIYQYYRGNSGNLVDITYSEIQTIGDTLWSQSSGLLDYAYRCYEYVALNFDYLNPASGLYDISTLFANNGGDCGNLSSIFISLLRYKDIPARHLITVRPDGNLHAWADFYLEGYGWIPADVTFAQSDADGDNTIDGDYFGDVSIVNNGIIMTKEVYITVHRGDTEVPINLLQTYGWWYWATNAPCTTTSTYTMIATSK